MKWKFLLNTMQPTEKPHVYKVDAITVDIEGFGEFDTSYEYAESIAKPQLKEGQHIMTGFPDMTGIPLDPEED